MERFFDSTKKKDKFLKDTLINYLLETVKKDVNNDVKSTYYDIAGMCVFPYKKGNATVFSTLDDDKNWYYKSQREDDSVLKDKEYYNIRILDEEFLGETNTDLIKKAYSKEIRVFSINGVIDDLISKMSDCSEFDETWWLCCRDIFDIWKSLKGNYYFKKDKAVIDKSIDDYFVFDDEKYCSSKMKTILIKYGIFSDILSTKLCKKLFKNTERKKLSELLVLLGIPNRFTTNDKYNPNLVKLFTKIYDSTHYPICSSDTNNYEFAMLSEHIVLKVFEESRNAFNSMYNNTECRKGMTVRNRDGNFISLSNVLFYSNSNTNKYITDIFDLILDYPTKIESQYHEYDELLINYETYSSDFIYYVASILDLNNINQSNISKITIDHLLHETNMNSLYRWMWQYNKSPSLADWILRNNQYEYFTSNDGYARFALEMLDAASIDCEINLNIELSLTDAFMISDIINRISRKEFTKSNLAVYLCKIDFCRIRKYDCKRIKDQVIRDVDPSASGSFYNEAFWNTIWTVDVSFLIEQENYVILQDEFDSKKTIILIPGSDEFIVKRCIKKYIHEQYDVSVNRMDEGLIDWAKEYQKLKKGLFDFIASKSERGTIDVISDKTIDIRDINSFAEEKRIWDKIREIRQKVMRANSRFDEVPFGPGKYYLMDKYKGYCQLCGDRTPNQSFNQLHIVEPHEFGYEKSFTDLEVNLLCTCPSCWGLLKHGYGNYDLSSISRAAKKYVRYFLDYEDEVEDGVPRISELYDEDDGYCIKDMIHPGGNQDYVIRNPIVFRVVVNGEEREMFFAWEHFLRIAMLLNEDIIYDEHVEEV